ncbi:MAG: hypothetical protein AAF598_05090 [Bacteroidota bacterium]
MSKVKNKKSNKLLMLIGSLSVGEVRAVRRHLYRHWPQAIPLFEHLQVEQLQGDQKKMLFKLLFPEASFSDLKLRHAFSDLVRHIESVLISRKEKEEPLKDHLAQMSIYLDKNVEKGFLTASKQFDKGFQDLSVKTSVHFRAAYQAENLRYRYYLAKAKRIEPESLNNALDYLEQAEILEKLKLYCALINSKSIIHTQFRTLDIESLLHRIHQKELDNQALIRIYLGILESLRNPDNEANFYQVFDLLQSVAPYLEREEAHELYIYLLNFCIRKINMNGRFLQESFDIYRTMIEQELLVRQKYLSPWTFKNVVVNGLRLNETDWVAQFIQDKLDWLPPESRKTAFHYNMARYHFHIGQFDEVLSLLQQIEYEDIFYSLDARALLMKSYYELDEFEAMYSLMDSFRILLRRKKGLSEKHRQNFANLIRFTRKASRIHPGDSGKVKALLAELNDTPQIADIRWIRSKIEDLY